MQASELPEVADRLGRGARHLVVAFDAGEPQGEVGQRVDEAGQVRARVVAVQAPVDLQRLLGGGERLGVPVTVAEPDAEVVQDPGELPRYAAGSASASCRWSATASVAGATASRWRPSRASRLPRLSAASASSGRTVSGTVLSSRR